MCYKSFVLFSQRRGYFHLDRGRLRSQPHPYNNRLKELLPPWPQFDECETNGTLTCFRAGRKLMVLSL